MQLLAAIANDADYMPSFLHDLGKGLVRPQSDSGSDVWGMGYYAEDHALLIHKPGDLVGERSFHELAPDVRSRVLIACAREDPSATAHAPLHRFRRWLFASVGDLSTLESLRDRIVDRLPDFIGSEMGAAGASELAFAMFLREQHERAHLNDALTTGSQLAEAMDRTTQTMTMLAGEAGLPAPAATYAATNGRVIIVSRHGPDVQWRSQTGLETLPDGPPDPAMTDFPSIVESLKRFRGVAFAANVTEPASGWTSVPVGRTIWVDRQLSVATVEHS